MAAVKLLAEMTDSEVEGLVVGSKTLTFIPRLPPTSLSQRTFKVVPDSSGASTMLALQAILPFLLYAGDESGSPIELEIHGGTNTTMSLSYEYMDQVLMPTLEERFGIRTERELKSRGWVYGPPSCGCVSLKIYPLKRGTALTPIAWDRSLADSGAYEVKSVDVTMIVPLRLQEPLQTALCQSIGELFPDVDINFIKTEDSGHDARNYVLLVGKSSAGLRWGRDILYKPGKKNKESPTSLSANISRLVTKELFSEVQARGQVDKYLQDQLVCFQALAAGRSSFPRHDPGPAEAEADAEKPNLESLAGKMKQLDVHDDSGDGASAGPFGYGTLHSKTARWITRQLLPNVEFHDMGDVVEGAGISFA